MRKYSHKTKGGSFIKSELQVLEMRILAIQRIERILDASTGQGKENIEVTYNVMKDNFIQDFGFQHNEFSNL